MSTSMAVDTPQIHWHGEHSLNQPIHSVHIQPLHSALQFPPPAKAFRVATAGGEVRIWHITPGSVDASKLPTMMFRASLERHESPINIARFCPDGKILASGDTDGKVILWTQTNEMQNISAIPAADVGFVNIETWTSRMLVRHFRDVTDLSWSSDGRLLLSTSVDDTAIIWSVETQTPLKVLEEAERYVLGGSWDPCSRFVATLSIDRILRVYNFDAERQRAGVVYKVSHLTDGVASEWLFLDDKNCGFRRRLDFSPDGNFLVTPAGIHNECACSYIFAVTGKKITRPLAILPCFQPTTMIRFCPRLFKLRPEVPQPITIRSTKSRSSVVILDSDNENMEVDTVTEEGDPIEEVKQATSSSAGSLVVAKNVNGQNKQQLTCAPLVDGLLYRMVFAVCSNKQIFLYDTQMERPFALIDGIHMLPLTDVTWSSNGRMLIVSSEDGFCTFVEFAEGELGEEYVPPPVETKLALPTELQPSTSAA